MGICQVTFSTLKESEQLENGIFSNDQDCLACTVQIKIDSIKPQNA